MIQRLQCFHTRPACLVQLLNLPAEEADKQPQLLPLTLSERKNKWAYKEEEEEEEEVKEKGGFLEFS